MTIKILISDKMSRMYLIVCKKHNAEPRYVEIGPTINSTHCVLCCKDCYGWPHRHTLCEVGQADLFELIYYYRKQAGITIRRDKN